jgi:hypothetical protein
MSQNKGLGTPALAQLTASTALWGGNSTWVEDLYERYLAGEAVPDDWQKYFSTLAVSRGDVPHGPIVRSLAERAQQPRTVVATHSSDTGGEKQAAVSRLIQIYTNRGHLIAKVDPLGLMQRATPRVMQLDYMGLSEADFDTEFYTGTRLEALPRRAKLREIVAMLDQVFAGPIGAEFAHVSDTDERLWLQDQFMLGRLQQQFSKEEKLTILRQLTAAEGLERYLHTKYVGQKRFSLEGGDALIPMLTIWCSAAASRASKRWSSAWRTAAASTCWSTCWARPPRTCSRNSRQVRHRASQGLGRRQVPQGLLGRPAHGRRQRACGAGLQSFASRGREPGGRRFVRARQERRGESATSACCPC